MLKVFKINYKGLGLFDYNDIVKKPMDLSTLRKKLNEQNYKKVIDVYNDINLIWNNCKRYNMENSDIYNSATHMEDLTNKLIRDNFLNNFLQSISISNKEKYTSDDLKKKTYPNKNITIGNSYLRDVSMNDEKTNEIDDFYCNDE
jgi:hypothetical protein